MSSTTSPNVTNICGSCRQAPGNLRCTRCRDAIPPTLYCSQRCQKMDWQFHKKYCGKKAYKFTMTLLGTKSPKVTRTFFVPAWWTFRKLHYTIQ
ncbi:hypothetical protein BDQ12DRAFT_691173 [Crucibulum laeve]|uniref:MYND-type domain-containing protein n=1 Tax=Crucibulum laeve TaxID=68775 RepID=A0A5C3LM77_9AGAR|nr:hypothetical protein BDQ12DRAFT_691173 [Crucibulum laeve]